MSDEIIIEAGRSEAHYWRDVWRFRELFLFLAWRDVTVRYKQTAIGIAWAIIRPLMTLGVFTVVFGRLAGLATGEVPYVLVVFAGVLPWQYFSNALTEGSASLVANANLVSKIYFPRLIIPTSSMVVSFVDFLFSFVIFVGLMAWYQFVPGWQIVLLPLFLLLGMAAALGGSLCFAALNVTYRDFRFVLPFCIQIALYISPVGFSSRIVPEEWRLIYSLNPMVGVIDGFRYAILGDHEPLYLPAVGVSALAAAVLLAAGIWYFRKTERSFADVI